MTDNINLLDQYMQEYLPVIEEELVRAIKRTERDVLSELHQMLTYHMGWEGVGAGAETRGKRIRPLLVLLCCAATGGDWKRALPAAAAVELIHNFSLIHDDIEDNSSLRHGRPTVWKVWGIPQAINAGDTLYALAHLEILQLEETYSQSISVRAARILQEACLSLTQGQYLDLSYENRNDLSQDDYWPMANGKTAALLAACTHLGALISEVDIERQTYFNEFGRFLGLAFQARDDFLGIWGDFTLTGKSIDSDLVSGKKSLPVLFGLAKRGLFAERWLRGPITPDEVPSIAQMLEDEGGRSYSEQMVIQHTSRAHQMLESANPEGPAGLALKQLTGLLLNRTS
jgi:geranylgeranyl diphosphate synthase type I